MGPRSFHVGTGIAMNRGGSSWLGMSQSYVESPTHRNNTRANNQAIPSLSTYGVSPATTSASGSPPLSPATDATSQSGGDAVGFFGALAAAGGVARNTNNNRILGAAPLGSSLPATSFSGMMARRSDTAAAASVTIEGSMLPMNRSSSIGSGLSEGTSDGGGSNALDQGVGGDARGDRASISGSTATGTTAATDDFDGLPFPLS